MDGASTGSVNDRNCIAFCDGYAMTTYMVRSWTITLTKGSGTDSVIGVCDTTSSFYLSVE